MGRKPWIRDKSEFDHTQHSVNIRG